MLHREQYAHDGTERYAAHILANRTDLSTRLRLDEGPARKAAATRATGCASSSARGATRAARRAGARMEGQPCPRRAPH